MSPQELAASTARSGACLLWTGETREGGIPVYRSQALGRVSARKAALSLRGVEMRPGQYSRPTCGNPLCLSHLAVQDPPKANGNRSRVLQLVKERPGIKREEIAELLGIKPATVGQHLWKLRSAGRVAADGVGRYTGWREGACASAPIHAAANDLMAAWFGRAA